MRDLSRSRHILRSEVPCNSSWHSTRGESWSQPGGALHSVPWYVVISLLKRDSKSMTALKRLPEDLFANQVAPLSSSTLFSSGHLPNM